jgi:hypothetical protein
MVYLLIDVAATRMLKSPGRRSGGFPWPVLCRWKRPPSTVPATPPAHVFAGSRPVLSKWVPTLALNTFFFLNCAQYILNKKHVSKIQRFVNCKQFPFFVQATMYMVRLKNCNGICVICCHAQEEVQSVLMHTAHRLAFHIYYLRSSFSRLSLYILKHYRNSQYRLSSS